MNVKQDDEGSSKVASGVFDDEDDDFLIQATNDDDTMASDDDMTGVTSKPTQPLFSDDDGGNFTHNLCSLKGNPLSHGFFNSSGSLI
jgi:hypothetical protein